MRVVFIASIILNIMFLSVVAYKKLNAQPAPISKESEIFNKARMQIYDSLGVSANDIVFVGNSITEGFPLQEFFHRLDIKNRGISGNRSSDILNRISEVSHAKEVFLMCGINDLKAGIKADSAFANFKRIASSVKGKLCVESVLPTYGCYSYLNSAINEYNEMVKDYCQHHGIDYLDLHQLLASKDYTYDGLHLKWDGYCIWAREIKKYL